MNLADQVKTSTHYIVFDFSMFITFTLPHADTQIIKQHMQIEVLETLLKIMENENTRFFIEQYIGPNHLFYQTSSRTILLDIQQQKNSLYWTSSRQCGLVHELPRPRKQQKNRSTGRPVERFYWTSSRILLDVQQSRRFGGFHCAQTSYL